MRIAWEQLHHLPVYTESGEKIGMVEGVTVDVDMHAIVHYQVKPSLRLAALFAKPLFVAPVQVIAITAERMTVKDSVAMAEPATNSEKTRLAAAAKPTIQPREME